MPTGNTPRHELHQSNCLKGYFIVQRMIALAEYHSSNPLPCGSEAFRALSLLLSPLIVSHSYPSCTCRPQGRGLPLPGRCLIFLCREASKTSVLAHARSEGTRSTDNGCVPWVSGTPKGFMVLYGKLLEGLAKGLGCIKITSLRACLYESRYAEG